jgi:nucleoside phosphorylase
MVATTAPLVDVLLLTALAEEQQVVEQVLQLRASYRGSAGEPPERVNVYAYPRDAAHPFYVATASIYQMGGVAMAAKAPGLFKAVRPESAVLLGISATVVPNLMGLGDVPVASQVIEYDDIAATPGKLIFRPEGYQVSPRLRDAAGALQVDSHRYSSWQDDCLSAIGDVVARLNPVRSTQIKAPSNARRPHLFVGIGAGGPFLIRDAAFRREVESLHPKLTWVEMESHGFMRAAHENHIEAIVIKGISDAGDADKATVEKDTGGFYRVFACSNATLAVLHLLDQAPWTPRAFDDRAHARAMLDRAGAESASANFESACKIAETCIGEARRLGERDLQCKARIFWIRCALQVPGNDTARAARVRESKNQLADVRLLGASEPALALLAAEIALSEGDGNKALRSADTVIGGAETVSEKFDGLLVKLQALELLGRPHEALSLESQVQGTLSKLPEGMVSDALALRVAWLRIRCLSDALTQDEVVTLVGDVRDLVARKATDCRWATTILRDLARPLEERGMPDELLIVLQGAYDLMRSFEDSGRLAGIATEIAEVALGARQVQTAMQYIGHAESWLARCTQAETDTSRIRWMGAQVRFARGRALMASAPQSNEDRRENLEQALEIFTAVLADLSGPSREPRADTALFSAEIASWAGRAAAVLGRMSSAVALFRQTRPEAALANPAFAVHVAYPAWLGEAQALLLSGEINGALDTTRRLCAHRGTPQEIIAQANEFERRVTRVVAPFVEWFRTADAIAIAERARADGVRATVAEQMRPLVSLWNLWREQEDARAAILDFWGRGGFSRIAAAISTSPHSVIAVDATSIEEIRRWARMLCPLFETVVVKWKGELGATVVSLPCRTSFPCDGELTFGGEGYWWTSSLLQGSPDWVYVNGWSNPVSFELASFLSGEALQLLATGRLVVLPAPLVGCSQTTVGWTDDLFLRLLGGVVNVVSRTDASPGVQILDLTTTTIPFLDGVPLDVLPAVLDETEEWIPDLRNMIWGRRSEQAEETWRTTISMEGDMRSAFRQLSERFQRLASSGDGRRWSVAHIDGALAAGRADVPGLTEEPVTALLRSVVAERTATAPWIPYWRLTGMGGRLSWSSPLDNRAVVPPGNLPESMPRDALYGEVQSWLCKGTTTGLRTVVVRLERIHDP